MRGIKQHVKSVCPMVIDGKIIILRGSRDIAISASAEKVWGMSDRRRSLMNDSWMNDDKWSMNNYRMTDWLITEQIMTADNSNILYDLWISTTCKWMFILSECVMTAGINGWCQKGRCWRMGKWVMKSGKGLMIDGWNVQAESIYVLETCP